jgi:hypothetical protein
LRGSERGDGRQRRNGAASHPASVESEDAFDDPRNVLRQVNVSLIASIDFALAAVPPAAPPGRSRTTPVFIPRSLLDLVTAEFDAESLADLGDFARYDHDPLLDVPFSDGKTVAPGECGDEIEISRVGAPLSRKLVRADITA